MWRLILSLIIAISLSSCASLSRKNDLKIRKINALSSTQSGDGGFKGLEFLANPVAGDLKNRINIFYVHGIGWTEDPDGDPLANDFIAGIAGAYGQQPDLSSVNSLCGDENHQNSNDDGDHIFITTQGETYFQTALSGSRLKLDRLVCMDKQIIEVDDVLEFAIYRVFWDDLLWNALQFQHVGQDDNKGSSQIFSALRRKYNRRLKDEMVNYGFSDAVMYLGPAGTELRRAVRGAMCSAALDASGHTFEKQGHEMPYSDACNLADYGPIIRNQFAFVTESLGSKIVYDVLQETLTDGQEDVIDDMVRGSEFYMLANQIPLLSLNDLSSVPRPPVKSFAPGDRPKIIALSELNDFLTYELIPFYRQIWDRSYRQREVSPNIYESSLDHASADEPESRAAMVEAIGFDVVDVRLEFADKLIPMVDGFVDPLQAHGGHMSEPELVRYILCGAVNGKLNAQACLATQRPN